MGFVRQCVANMKPKRGPLTRFHLRRHHLCCRRGQDPRAVDLWFHESVYSVLKDKHFTVENDVALDLAAYQMQAVHSDHQKKLHGPWLVLLFF